MALAVTIATILIDTAVCLMCVSDYMEKHKKIYLAVSICWGIAAAIQVFFALVKIIEMTGG